ncbi:phage terminase large subunit family protein [Brevibacillus composti]|uniref:Phage terminase large subunit family protein n=1 Tax=Brevibacillus composti TaxID=2796470 RepID=A0A7T5EN77_9BACL|nr:phage terminase large subunit family protein [Brevibacillus composti]QQE75709.1 phage terminase large subunit family protein [Brevibacillus composti]QUO42735.1 phage terminase large subunit family protein [Brevibacillus composti]
MSQKLRKLYQAIAQFVSPPPELTITEWADRYRYLSPESSAEPGKYRSERAPYQREMMDAISDPEVQEVVFMMGSQLGKTLTQENVIGYYIDQDPSPMMLVMPTLDMSKAFSKDRLSTMVRDTPVLRDKIADAKAKVSGNTILHKSFPGGHITLVGSNSPASLASRPIRILLVDELDRFEATSEGDALDLAKRRTATFANRKIVIASTPTIKDQSRIEQLYKKTSSMGTWQLPCPQCGEYQPLEWSRVMFESVSMRCMHCGFDSPEIEWKKQQIAGKGKWVHEHPERKVKGFHMNALASPWTRWAEMIEIFQVANEELKNGNPKQMQVFVNTLLSETWEDYTGDTLDQDDLLKRREDYDAELPPGVLILTMAVDTQNDRLEYEVVGWGKDEEAWGIEKGIIWGKPDDKRTWQMLDDKRKQTWHFADGTGMVVACTCVDSGGHFTDEVYKYCVQNLQERVFPIKGEGGDGIPLVHKVSRNNKYRLPLILLGVDAGKTAIMQRLQISEPGARYFHFPKEDGRGYDQVYFAGLVSERQVFRKKGGQVVMVWENVAKDRRNEPLDLRVYGMAALRLLNPNFEALEKRLKEVSTRSEKSVKPKQNGSKKRYGAVKRAALD